MPDSVVLVPREFRPGPKPDKNNVDKIRDVIAILEVKPTPAHVVAMEILESVITDLKVTCKHEPGYLLVKVQLQPSRVRDIFLAQTGDGLLITLAVGCKKCNDLMHPFVGEVCPSCLGGMRKVRGHLRVAYTYPEGMSICDKCNLTVVWDLDTVKFDYLSQDYVK